MNLSAAVQLPSVYSVPGSDPANDGAVSVRVFDLPTLPSDGTVTLRTLVQLFHTPDADCRMIHLRAYTDDALVAEGVKVHSQRILDAVPRLVASVVRTLSGLTEAQAELVTLDPALFAVIVHETARLQTLYDAFVRGSASSSVRKVAHANVREELRVAALAQRDAVRTGLVQVLGAARANELALAQDASDDRALAAGLEHLADVIDRVCIDGSVAEKAQLERRWMSVARATKLRGMAASLRDATDEGRGAQTTEPVTQRALDLQDGRVLVLLDALVGSMQTAHRANKAIELPDGATLASRYRSRPRSARGKGRVGKAPAVNPEPNAKPE